MTHEWNHGLGEIISALLAQGLDITGLVEHQSIPWEALPGQMVVDERGEWRLKEAPWRLPLSYTLQAVKRRGLIARREKPPSSRRQRLCSRCRRLRTAP